MQQRDNAEVMNLTTDYQPYLNFAAELAAECGALAVETFGQHTAQRKSDGTLVTKTDEAIDRLISTRISDAYPSHAILSEEQATVYDPAIEFTWVVDPLDGTTNFTNGLPIWGVSIALLQHGRPIVGVVDFPLLGEQYQAVLGGGAARGMERLSASALADPNDEQFLMKCTRTDRIYQLTTPLKSRIMGSAAYHICKVADGTALAGIEASPKIWDVAAAWLIVKEAGGEMIAASGATIFPLAAERRDYLTRAITTFTAANPTILQHVTAAAKARTE
jgi:myo-inositol-1(or 4)-monophosphatase